ncbi:hypothetical protein NA57DRAFT_70657 [Rhizodiscina lignyota]|uniref:P-loop containing nucleoside triphosphate hydrolase protein n=1 Tax=Rhizodiscina lignyota TaxID=1504668 RepID=A0A9P4IQV7_9PEZI|nr:hypothetical protein NA57DRAFT_70657 [Rhizodiscina lignyota]
MSHTHSSSGPKSQNGNAFGALSEEEVSTSLNKIDISSTAPDPDDDAIMEEGEILDEPSVDNDDYSSSSSGFDFDYDDDDLGEVPYNFNFDVESTESFVGSFPIAALEPKYWAAFEKAGSAYVTDEAIDEREFKFSAVHGRKNNSKHETWDKPTFEMNTSQGDKKKKKKKKTKKLTRLDSKRACKIHIDSAPDQLFGTTFHNALRSGTKPSSTVKTGDKRSVDAEDQDESSKSQKTAAGTLRGPQGDNNSPPVIPIRVTYGTQSQFPSVSLTFGLEDGREVTWITFAHSFNRCENKRVDLDMYHNASLRDRESMEELFEEFMPGLLDQEKDLRGCWDKHGLAMTRLTMSDSTPEQLQTRSKKPHWIGLSQSELEEILSNANTDARSLVVLLDLATSISIFTFVPPYQMTKGPQKGNWVVHQKYTEFKQYFMAAAELTSRFGLCWYYRIEGVKAHTARGGEAAFSMDDALAHPLYRYRDVLPPRWLAYQFNVYSGNSGQDTFILPTDWAAFDLPPVFPNAETAAFFYILSIERDRDYERLRLEYLSQAAAEQPTNAIFLQHPELPHLWEIRIDFVGEPTTGTEVKHTDRPIRPDNNARVRVTWTSRSTGKTTRNSFTGTVMDTNIGGDGDVVVAAYGYHPNFKPLETDGSPRVLPVEVVWTNDPTSSNRLVNAIGNILKGQKRIEGIDIPNLVLFNEPTAPNQKNVGYTMPNIRKIKFRSAVKKWKLNPLQQTAAEFPVAYSNHQNLTTIWGPPGTGKTNTAAAIVAGNITIGQKTIVCAPSNAVVDEACRKLIVYADSQSSSSTDKIDKSRILRFKGAAVKDSSHLKLSDAEKALKDMDVELLLEAYNAHWDLVEKQMGIREPHKDLAFNVQRDRWISMINAEPESKNNDHRKVQQDVKLLGKLKQQRDDQDRFKKLSKDEKGALKGEIAKYNELVNKHFLNEHVDVVYVTCSSSAHQVLENFKVAHLIVEDAGLGNVGDIATPLAAHKENIKSVSMSGDNLQNKPLFNSRGHNEAGNVLTTSFFEKIVNDPFHRFPVHRLQEQYRMHPEISEFVNKAVYAGQLKDTDTVMRPHPIDETFRTANGVFAPRFTKTCSFAVDTSGDNVKAEKYKDSTSWCNEIEADRVVQYAQFLLQALPPPGSRQITPEDIGIITPYTGQAYMIQKMLSERQVPVCVYIADPHQPGSLVKSVAEDPTLPGKVVDQTRDVNLGDIQSLTTTRVQGSEFTIALISLVMKQSGPIAYRNNFHLGWIMQSNQLCVEFSRAKRAQVVFGDFRHWVYATLNEGSAPNKQITRYRKHRVFKQMIAHYWTKHLIVSSDEWDKSWTGQPAVTFESIIDTMPPMTKRKGRR